jgi:hypothetical protein
MGAISNESMCIFCCVLIEKVKEAWRAVCLTVLLKVESNVESNTLSYINIHYSQVCSFLYHYVDKNYV